MTDSTGRLTRSRLQLTEFEFDGVLRAGIKGQAAGVLPRLPTNADGSRTHGDDLPLLAIEATDKLVDTRICATDKENNNIVLFDGSHINFSLDTPPTKNEYIVVQAQDNYCKTATLEEGVPGFEFFFDYCGLLIRKSIIDETTQVFVPDSLRELVLYLSYLKPIAGQAVLPWMYDTLLPTCHCTYMVSCAQNKSPFKHKRHLRSFLAKEPLDFVAMDILDPLPKPLQEKNTFWLPWTAIGRK